MRDALTRALSSLPEAGALAADAERCRERLADRIRRDLLPRVAGPSPTLIVGIAGPNNVGKSSLFNALVGAPLSPARPEGGLTKQCLAAAPPSLWTGPLRALLEERYEIVEVRDGETPPVTEPGPPGRLYLLLRPAMPEGVLLMDTPDFDSVHQTNRRAAEALLVTADVVLFVVSRHTYQNGAVVSFLRQVVGHGRPYALVYNEAVREEVARAHLAKLVQDVGHEPLAQELALHQPQVESGSALLVTRPAAGGAALGEVLRDPGQLARVKAKALAASLQDARAEFVQVAQALEAAVGEPDRLRGRIRREILGAAERAALLSVPADVLIEAFRDELDARSPVHKWLRKGPRLLASGLTVAGRFLARRFTGPETALPPLQVRVRRALDTGVAEVAAALSAEVGGWRGPAETRALLSSTLAKASGRAADQPRAYSIPLEQDSAEDRRRLYDFCRRLLAQELPAGPGEELRQLLATVAYAIPAVAGVVGAVTVPGVTGGGDVVFASALVTTPLLERLVDLLGAGVRDSVAQAWRRSRGATLAREVERDEFGPLLDHLDQAVEDGQHRAKVLRETAEELRGLVEREALR